MMCKKKHDWEEMGRLIKRQFLDFNVPWTTQGHLRTLVKKRKEKKSEKAEWNSLKNKTKTKKLKDKKHKKSYTKCYEEQNHLNY